MKLKKWFFKILLFIIVIGPILVLILTPDLEIRKSAYLTRNPEGCKKIRWDWMKNQCLNKLKDLESSTK